MKATDLTSLKSLDSNYKKASDTISEKYKGDWDDQIHDSYLRYVNHIQENARKINVIRCKMEALEKEAEDHKINELKRMCESLCKEADSI